MIRMHTASPVRISLEGVSRIWATDHALVDMVKLVHHVYKEFNAEAVCIISNQPLTQKVVYGLMARGEYYCGPTP